LYLPEAIVPPLGLGAGSVVDVAATVLPVATNALHIPGTIPPELLEAPLELELLEAPLELELLDVPLELELLEAPLELELLEAPLELELLEAPLELELLEAPLELELLDVPPVEELLELDASSEHDTARVSRAAAETRIFIESPKS
jgi:hypothetical protein